MNDAKQITTTESGIWGRAIFETAKTSVDDGSFGSAWRQYVFGTKFSELPEHDRALIRIAFVAGWRAHQEVSA